MVPDSLLERDAEIADLRAAVARAVAGQGGVVLLEGAAGIGKTRLIATAAALAREAGANVRTARAGEIEQSFPFGVVRQLFEPVLATADHDRYLDGAAALAAPLFDPARFADSGDDAMYPRLHGLFWLAVNVSHDAPLVLCVDDAQWCDEPSLLLLDFLSRRIADLPVLVFVATRPVGPASPRSLVGLVTDGASTVLRPAGLSHAAVSTLLVDRLGRESEDAFTAACLQSTGGNPFLLGELARLLAGEAMAPVARMAAHVAGLGPKAIADHVLLRVSRLSPGAGGIATAIAVLGDGVPLADVAGLAGVDAAAAAVLIRELREAGVLAEGAELSFAHPVLRTAIYEALVPAEREQAHLDAATLLSDQCRPAEQVAAHLLAVERPLGPWTVAVLREAAAHALAVGDVAIAERYLGRALLEPLDAGERGDILATLGHAQVLVMAPAAVETLQEAIAVTARPAVAVQASLDLAVMLLFSGRIEPFVAVLTAAEQALGDADPGLAERLSAGLLGSTQISIDAARLLAPRIDALRDPGGVAVTLADRVSLINLAWHGSVVCRPVDELRDFLHRAISSAAFLTDPQDALVSPMMACAPMIVTEMYDQVDALLSGDLETARFRGSAFNAAAALSLRSWVGVRRGNLADAETDAREALDLIEAVGFPSFHTSIAQATLIACALETGGDLAPWAPILDGPAPPPELIPNSVIMFERAAALAARGDLEDALAALMVCGAPDWVGGNPALISWRSSAALILAQLGREDEAIALADDELARARAYGAARTLGIALRTRGRLAGAGPEAEPLLEEAVTVLASSDASLEHARALVELGALVRRTGERTRSRELLRKGHDLAVRCGATVLAETARQELAASGQRVATPGLSGAQALTPSERRVARMAADGLRNREIAQSLFVTEKTVETHLSRAYDKLDIRSRGKLAKALAG